MLLDHLVQVPWPCPVGFLWPLPARPSWEDYCRNGRYATSFSHRGKAVSTWAKKRTSCGFMGLNVFWQILYIQKEVGIKAAEQDFKFLSCSLSAEEVIISRCSSLFICKETKIPALPKQPEWETMIVIKGHKHMLGGILSLLPSCLCPRNEEAMLMTVPDLRSLFTNEVNTF